MYNDIKDFLSDAPGFLSEIKDTISDLRKEKPILQALYAPLLFLIYIIGFVLFVILLPFGLIKIVIENIQSYLYVRKFHEMIPITHWNIKEELINYLSINHVVYIEDDYCQEINEYISEKYEGIKNKFWMRQELHFVYVPKIMEKLRSNFEEIAHYYRPNFANEEITIQQDISPQDIYKLILSYCKENAEKPLKPGLIHICYPNGEKPVLSFVPIASKTPKKLQLFFELYISKMGMGSVYHATVSVPEIKDEKDFSDYNFPEEATFLINEVRLKIEQLKALGIDELVLQKLLLSKSQPVISKLLITNDFRIFLPDYDNMEINMAPLPKTLFLLYLKHPEGIMFKQLSNHKKELLEIYSQVSNRENPADMKRSIEDLIDSSKNTVNEKCSRIREAFVKEFDDRLARYYYITGKRFTAKKIELDRSYVIWEIPII